LKARWCASASLKSTVLSALQRPGEHYGDEGAIILKHACAFDREGRGSDRLNRAVAYQTARITVLLRREGWHVNVKRGRNLGPLPSRAGAPPILALRWICPRICQSLVLLLPLSPRSIRLITQQSHNNVSKSGSIRGHGTDTNSAERVNRLPNLTHHRRPFSRVRRILMILLPARPSRLNAMSMPSTRRNVCARRRRPASAPASPTLRWACSIATIWSRQHAGKRL